MPNRLGHLTLFKHHLNGLNAKQRVTDCLPFSVLDNIASSINFMLQNYFKLLIIDGQRLQRFEVGQT